MRRAAAALGFLATAASGGEQHRSYQHSSIGLDNPFLFHAGDENSERKAVLRSPPYSSLSKIKLDSRDDEHLSTEKSDAAGQSIHGRESDEDDLMKTIGTPGLSFSSNKQSALLHRSNDQALRDIGGTVPDLSSSFSPQRHLRKTGTTIAGIVGRDFCILAADTRATMGMTVADTSAEKLHSLLPRIWAAGAGTSADLQHLTRACRYTFQLSRLQQDATIGNPTTTTPDDANAETKNESRPSFPSMAGLCHWLREELFRQSGACEANLLVGGYCPKSRSLHLRALHPHGSTDVLAFGALGSGGLAATAVLEQALDHRQACGTDGVVDCSLAEAVEIAKRAIRAGIENDLGSGSQIDLVIVQKVAGEGDAAEAVTTEYLRAAVPEPQLPPLSLSSSAAENDAAFGNRTGGVNGFGNTPFVLRPVKTTKVLTEKRLDVVEREWDEILGL